MSMEIKLCPKCGRHPTKTPNASLCNSCYVQKYRKLHPEKRNYYYGKDIDKVFLRANGHCERCNKECSIKELEIHHKDGVGSQLKHSKRNNKPENLLAVCSKCHGHLERNKRGGSKIKRLSQWSIKYLYCQKCFSTKFSHIGKGICMNCRQNLPINKLKYKRLLRKWAEKRKLSTEKVATK